MYFDWSKKPKVGFDWSTTLPPKEVVPSPYDVRSWQNYTSDVSKAYHKPRIFWSLVWKKWLCAKTFGAIGEGDTPREAYNRWRFRTLLGIKD